MNAYDENEIPLKFLLLGDSGSGKTSLFMRYTDYSYCERVCVLIFKLYKILMVYLVNRN